MNLSQSAKRLVSKVQNFLSRGILQNSNDQAQVQTLQIGLQADEVLSEVEHPHEYGFTSRALQGAQVIAAFHGGNRDNGTVIIVYDKRNRFTELDEGEVAVYTHDGTVIHLRNDGEIEITASTRVTINCPETNLEGNLNVSGNIACDGQVSDATRSMSQDRSIYNGHTHNETGGVTNAPNETQ